MQLRVPPSQVLKASEKKNKLAGKLWFRIKDCATARLAVLSTDQLLHPSGASVVSPGSNDCPVLRSRQGQSSLSTHTVPLADRTFPSVQ